MIYVEKCKNWLEYFMSHGKHCFNCANRNGYPYRGQPSKACSNFQKITTPEKVRKNDV